MNWNILRAAALAAVFLSCGFARAQVSPFAGLKFESDDSLIVRIDDMWVKLVSVGGVRAEDLVDGSKDAFGAVWQKRIGEDLLDVFDAVGINLEHEDKIDVRYRLGDEVVTVLNAPMTHSNRKLIRDMNNGELPWFETTGTREQLEQLLEVISSRHAYATLRGVDLDELIEVELATLGDEATLTEIRRSAHRIVCQLGDGHARVRDWRDGSESGYLPVRFERVRNGIVVYWADRSGLVDRSHPYIERIDGIEISDWIEAMSSYVTAGSAQLVELRALGELGAMNLARRVLGRDLNDEAILTVRNTDGTSRVEIRVDLFDRWPPYVEGWSRDSGQVDGDIGYLRLGRMFPEVGVEHDDWFKQLRREFTLVTDGASGLVIDVRGNGGGHRDPILALMPCLMGEDDQPIVVNSARYRLEEGDDPNSADGYLANRFLYPIAWS